MNFVQRNWISISVILAICLILILPVIIYQYPYPNHSDDFPRHLEVIERVVNGQDYSELWVIWNGYAGPAFTGLVIKALHTDPYWTFYVIHYLALIGMVLSIWYFSFKVFNKTAANLALPFVVLCTPPFLQYFYNGVIFSMINLFIFGLMAILALVNWQKTKRPYYAVVSMLLFAIATLYHCSTGLYLLAGVGAYLGAATLINAKNKAWGQVRRLMAYTAALAAICGALGFTLAPQLRQLAGLTVTDVTGGATAMAGSSVSVPSFLLLYSNGVIICLFVVAMIYIWRRKIKLSPAMGVLLALIFMLALAVFVFKFVEPTRAAHDLAMLMSLAAAGAVGVALERVKIYRKCLAAIGLVVVIAMALPMTTFWLTYQSAVRPVDQEAIAALEELPGDTYSVSTQISQPIYSLFVDGKICTRAGGDYIVFRDNPMSGETDPANVWCHVYGNVSTEADYDGLPVVGEFYDGKVRIVIYTTRYGTYSDIEALTYPFTIGDMK